MPGERLGVVGRNGHGKTTLFKILLGEEQADSGEVFTPKNYRVGHLSQHLEFKHPTILEEVSSVLPEQEGGWFETYKAEEMLSGLGFSPAQFSESPSKFSGGYQIRLNLAKLILKEPNLLLLDEPTNYLDIVAVRWLIRFLQTWKNELMLITHDRDFMDSVTTHTMAIHRAKAKKIEGSTAKLYEQIVVEEAVYEQTRQNEEKRKKEIQKFIDRFRAQAAKASSVQSRVKALEKMGAKSELGTIATLDFEFRAAPFPGKWPLEIQDLSFSFDPKQPPLIEGVSAIIGKKDRVAVIGRNGRGKTTLLNLMAGELKETGGKVILNPNAKVAYFGQTNIGRLNLDKTIEQEITDVHPERNRSVARNICGQMMFEGDAALKKIRFLSGGERSRVLLGKILVTPANVLLLDEPTNHLDMESIDALLEAVDAFDGAVIMVTHSELILRTVPNRLIVFDRGEVQLFEGGYEEFLERIGWEQEDELREAEPVKKAAKKKEDLKPLRKKMRQLEEEIVALEKGIEEKNNLIADASKKGDSWAIAEHSKKLKESQERIEKIFAEMNEVSAQLAEAN